MFDLRTSPFYLLGVSPRDNRATIAQATETAISEGVLDEVVATRAQQVLMSPRLRLGAELSWLPGLAPNRVKLLIEGESLAADAIAGLPLLTGANLAAYRCSSQAVPVHHELLFRFYEQRNDDEVLKLVNSERRVSNFPEVQLDLLQDIIPEVTQQHTASFIEFVTREPWPGRTLLSVLKQHFVDGSSVIGFLDDLAHRFDDWAAGSFQQAEEAITRALNTIKEKPASLDEQLPAFTAAIRVWASVAAPHQFILARRHLNDPRTEQLLSKIRGVCLHLNNEVGDPRTSLALTKAALPAFEGSPGHHDTVTADLKTLEERVAENDAFKLIKPLVDFVTDLKSRHSEICSSIRRGNFKRNGSGAAGKLFDLFQISAKDLAGSQAGGAPFRIILSLAIDLANDSQASEEALILIRALEAFDDVSKDEQLVAALRSNGLIAHRTVLQKKLTQTAQARRNRQSASLAQQLADTATDDEDRAGWTKVRAQFEHRAKVQTWKFGGIAAAIGGFIIYATIEDNNRTTYHPGSPSQYRAPSSQDYNEAIRLNPQTPTAYHNRGYANADKGQYDQAIADFSEAIRLNPNYAEAYHSRAIAYANKKQYTEAIEDYHQTLRINTSNAVAFSNRGLAYANLGQFDRAIQDYSQAILLNPQNASTFNSRGYAYSRRGEFDKAIADYNESIRLNSQNSYAFGNRGFAYLRTNNVDLALQDFDRAIQIDPRNIGALFGRGSAYTNKGEFGRAVQDFDKAISLDKEQPVVFGARGHALARLGQYDRAISDFTQAIQLGPQNPSPVIGRSLAYLAHGDVQLALADCEEAMRLAPTRKDLIENRGLVYLRQNRIDLALSDFERALQFNPRLSWSLFSRGIIRLRRGDTRGNSDIATAQSIQSDVAADLARYGIRR
jgi:tetratricopeptide (TPR) repeat protein